MNFSSGCIVYLNILNPATGIPFAESILEARQALVGPDQLKIINEKNEVIYLFSLRNVLFVRNLETVGPAHAEH